MQGATRLLDMSDLQRFRELPIVVAFNAEVKGKMQTVSHVMELEQLDEDNEEATWRLANMKGNFGARTAQHKELAQTLPICKCTCRHLKVYIWSKAGTLPQRPNEHSESDSVT